MRDAAAHLFETFEGRAHLQGERGLPDQLRRHYLAWVDMPLPALGGETPRETVGHRTGKQKVQQLIREMPDVAGGGPSTSAAPPRNELRRLLGLKEEG